MHGYKTHNTVQTDKPKMSAIQATQCNAPYPIVLKSIGNTSDTYAAIIGVKLFSDQLTPFKRDTIK